jgi:hypothetical protein
VSHVVKPIIERSDGLSRENYFYVHKIDFMALDIGARRFASSHSNRIGSVVTNCSYVKRPEGTGYSLFGGNLVAVA